MENKRDYYIYDGSKENRDRNKEESDFENLVFKAYKSSKINGFRTLHAKKGDIFVSLGPINLPLSRNHVEEVIEECIKNKITSVDILVLNMRWAYSQLFRRKQKIKV